MGEHVIKMPDIGEGIAEVEVVAWHVKPGDEVAEDQLLAEVMTDKATVEIPSPVVGKVVALGGQVGEVMAVGTELVRLEVAGAGNAKAATPKTVPTTSTPDKTAPQTAAREQAAAPSAAPEPTRDKASPVSTEQATRAPDEPDEAEEALPETWAASDGQRAGGSAVARSAPASRAPARPPGEKPLASPAVRRRSPAAGSSLGPSATPRTAWRDIRAAPGSPG